MTVMTPSGRNGLKRSGILDGSGDHRENHHHTHAHADSHEKNQTRDGCFSTVTCCGWFWLARLRTIVTVTQDWFPPRHLLFVFFSYILHEAGEGTVEGIEVEQMGQMGDCQ